MDGAAMKRNTLYYGDCLEVMRAWPEACVDLIYLDPPFNSNADYNIIYGNQQAPAGQIRRKDLAQLTAFSDTWEWSEKTAVRISAIKQSVGYPARNAVRALDIHYPGGSGMLAYLVYMADRISEMSRVLKDTGAFYIHCDPTASHYLKMICDCVFGARNFRNEIIWHHPKIGVAKRKFTANTDTLLFYAKSDDHYFSPQHGDEPNELHTRWKSKLRGDKLYYAQAKRIKDSPVRSKIRVAEKTLGRRLNDADVVVDFALPENRKAMDNVWKIPFLKGNAKESLGYPTQKPLALLKRVVLASSREGDLVLDPFCGCGTTVEAAMQLKRDFIGIDISMYALDVIQKERLTDVKFVIEGIPRDLQGAQAMLRARPFAFEKWAVHLIPGFISNNKQTGDGGIDGWAGLLAPPDGEDGICIAQVKGGKPSVDALRAFAGKIKNREASVGVFITMEKWDTPTVKQCVAEAGALQQGASAYNRLVMWSIEEYFAGAKPALPPLAHPRTGAPLQEDLMVSR